jgi:hypothetical protein
MFKRIALGFCAALLPASEREALVARLDVAVPVLPASWTLATVQLSLIPAWALLGVSYGREVAGTQAEAILAAWDPPSFVETMLASVALGPLAFLFSAQGLVLEYVIVTGLVRAAGLVASGHATGDPLLTLLAWLRRQAATEIRRRRRLWRLGPWRPDRILPDGAGLLVLSSRDKPDWNERVTIEHNGAFYRLARREDRPQEGGVDVAYVLRPQRPGEIIRSLIRLEAPEDTSLRKRVESRRSKA